MLELPGAGGDPAAPRTVVTPILHTGDPAPGIADATMVWMGPPQIDAAGNVLIIGFYRREGDPFSRTDVWYGGAGSVQVIACEGLQAPDMPAGVVFDLLPVGRLSENGWIGLTALVAGPGIVPGVNDLANFVGPPGDIRKVLQGGDPAPGLEPGTVIDAATGARRLDKRQCHAPGDRLADRPGGGRHQRPGHLDPPAR